jgi:hypothetical protein
MLHLSIERLAALADELPTADEKMHLDQCADCAREREAHRSLLEMAGSERGSLGMPLTRWDSLASRLRDEGLMVGGRASSSSGSGFTLAGHWWLRAAAALLLVAGGMALGRKSAGQPILPGINDGATPARQTAAAVTSPEAPPTTFASIDEAMRFKNFYSQGYQNALAFLAQNDSGSRPVGTPAVMRARLAALDRVTKTMQEALSDAPSDPVINDFYLNSFGQREAALRQLNTVLPQNVRLNSF